MILKPIDSDFITPSVTADLDDILRNIFVFNDINFIETDQAGAQIEANPYDYFAINRVLLIRPISKSRNNRYAGLSHDCLLTIAKPISPDVEVEFTTGDVGQFEKITKDFLSIDFFNTFKSYFSCFGYSINITQMRPIWNSTNAAKRINHSGVEISLTIEI